MNQLLTETLEILDWVVGCQTLPATSNRGFVHAVEAELRRYGLSPSINWDETGERGNIHALIGPRVAGGVDLNGHSDVVPAGEGGWSGNPFRLDIRDGKAFGRGAVDMKGVLVCILAAIPMWQAKDLKRPIHVSFCLDKEIGGLGASMLVDEFLQKSPCPEIAIVGEPTRVCIVNGHKGAFEMAARFTGKAAHASDPGTGANAAYQAAKFITYLEDLAAELASASVEDCAFDPPYDTISVGTVNGGLARNIIPDSCHVDWEIRAISGENGEALLSRISEHLMQVLLPAYRSGHPEADAQLEIRAIVPPLTHEQSADAVSFLATVTGIDDAHVVPFGTDTGHFAAAGIPAAIFGPGSIEQAHQTDEFIELSQLSNCLQIFDQLRDRLAA